MAETTQVVPSKKERATPEQAKNELEQKKAADALSQVFDRDKKYMFELAVKNPEREHPVINMVTKRPAQHQEFPPYRNIVLTSQVVWNGKGILSNNIWTGRRMLRYYDGCETIFQDEQPKDKDTIEQLIKGTDTMKYAFREGRFGCYGDERMLLLYMFICSWNGDSEFRTRTAQAIFITSDKTKQAQLDADSIDQIEEALSLAKNASEDKMSIHSYFLGIPATDWDSGNELSSKEMRTAYRKRAREDAKYFIETFGNRAIETKYYIDKALLEGQIDYKSNPNKAKWKQSGADICDISGLKSHEAVADRLFEHSQTEDGSEFQVQVKALYN